ncbi:glycosyltransferase [Microbacterium sp. KSW2-21]|uniref:D-inositol 3-phosphate glycosyltransferase n=1 Tax=Microbacterium algihabitans TaxID=3075992 RepID=A0ABU3RVF3_9MICO|nr:glycosyltransferase [Microbacterium sp. KSW2-21]MDU0326863.1 glycosyltransferase [Microbacterium sp. KSW2-21]
MTDVNFVQVANSLSISDGGPARNCFELNLALNRHSNVTAALVSVQRWDEDNVVSEFVRDGGTLPVCAPSFLRLLGNRRGTGLRRLVKLIRSADGVIVHGLFMPWVIGVVTLSSLFRKPLLLMPHGALTPHELRKGKAKKHLFIALVRLLTSSRKFSIVTGSQEERDDVARQFPYWTTQWSGVGTDIHTTPVDDRPMRDPAAILTMSRLAPKKRIDLAIEACAVLRDRGVNVHLTIAGAGDRSIESELKTKVTALDLQKMVTFAGAVQGGPKRALYAESDIFLLPSEDENFGIAVAEAAVSGLRVVASSAVAAAKIIPTGATLIDQLQPAAIADGLMNALTSDPSRDGRHQVSSDAQAVFGWQPVAERWVTAFETIQNDH